jgi:hypothetical protein
MPTANVQYPVSLEHVYSSDAFAIDAAQNGQEMSQVVHGVRILSAPNASGYFDFERASQLAAEAKSSTFLAPYRREAKLTDAERDSTTLPDPRDGYEDFLADIIAAAQQLGFKPEKSPGRNEPRLQGLRQ